MFIQTYGTTYFGKRLPIQTSKQLNTTEGLSLVIDTTKVYIVFLGASANGVAYLKPYVVTKNIEAITESDVDLIKGVKVSIHGSIAVPVKHNRGINLIPITVYGSSSSFIGKQVLKPLRSSVQDGISLGKARVYEMEFIGEFKPGDTIVIDTKHFTVTLNGVNALHLVGNDNFPQLLPGVNELIYTDNEGQRTVRVRVIWQDRWM